MTTDKTPSDAQLIAELEAAGVAFMAFRGGLGGTKDIWTTRGSQDARKIAAGLRAVLAKWGSPVVAGEPVAVIEFTDGVKEPRIMSWNALPVGQHRVYTTPQPTHAQTGAVPLTAKQMESGRDAIFSTGNPYCPCDSKTFRKVAEWVERHHGITHKEGGQHADR